VKRRKRAAPVKLERCEESRDARALLELGIAAMVRASRSGDVAVAKKAGEWLVKYAGSLLKEEERASGETAGKWVC
jgi:hypothetical protein